MYIYYNVSIKLAINIYINYIQFCGNIFIEILKSYYEL